MATYTELFDLKSESELRNKIAVAVMIKAQAYINGATPTTDELSWSSRVLVETISEADKLLLYLLGVNNAQDTSTITGASDLVIQNQVDTAVDALVAGGIV